MLGLVIQLNPEVKDYSLFFFLLTSFCLVKMSLMTSIGVVSKTSDHSYHETAMQPQLTVMFILFKTCHFHPPVVIASNICAIKS